MVLSETRSRTMPEPISPAPPRIEIFMLSPFENYRDR
jgi:hypothetical protein